MVTPLFSTTVECDLLAMSGGWTPTIHLTSHLGGKPVWDDGSPRSFRAHAARHERCGRGRRPLHPGRVPDDGRGRWPRGGAGGGLQPDRPQHRPPPVPRAPASVPLWRVQKRQRKGLRRLPERRHRQGSRTRRARGVPLGRALKRYTTLGMATDQGKTSNVNAVGIMSECASAPSRKTGTTTFRPPYTPVAMGALGGHHTGKAFRPTRRTAAHDWAAENKARPSSRAASGCARSGSPGPARQTGCKAAPAR